MIKAVLFDFDGTLVDSSEGITKSVQYALRHFGIEEENLSSLHKFIGPPLWDSFKKYYHFTEEQAEEAVQVYRSRYEKQGIYEVKLYPHVKEVLTALREQGYLISLASSKPERTCKAIMEHLGLMELFHEIVGASHDGTISTKEEVLRELFRRWQDISQDEMILVGDTIFDVEGAARVGMRSIGVTFGFGDVRQMLDGGAVCMIDDLMELVQEVAKL